MNAAEWLTAAIMTWAWVLFLYGSYGAARLVIRARARKGKSTWFF